jgi:hypothetical protein
MDTAVTRSIEAAPAEQTWLDCLVARDAFSGADVMQIEAVRADGQQSLASVALRLGKVSERALVDAMCAATGDEHIDAAAFPLELLHWSELKFPDIYRGRAASVEIPSILRWEFQTRK